MADLVFGLIIMTLLCVALFKIGLRAARFQTPNGIRLLAVATVASVLSYKALLWDKPILASLLPFSNLIVVGNWFPLGAAFLSGVIFDVLPRSRRSAMLSVLAASSAFCVAHPLLGTAPGCGEQFDADGRSVQTTEATCSAACAASLLRSYGIDATEQEMAELCLTRNGTRWQGLYRGLKTKTKNTRWDVKVVSGTANELSGIGGQLILTVGLGQSNDAETLTAEFGWAQNVNHSVICLSFDANGDPLIYDPSPGYGKERWPAKHLKQLYRGHALQLVKRTESENLTRAFRYRAGASELLHRAGHP
jgi:hypothetical protein